MMGGNRQWIPLKLNASGVMPIILLRLSCLYLRLWLVYLSQTSPHCWRFSNNMFGFAFSFATLIVVFTFFYTAITVPTNKMSDDLKEAEVYSRC
jgi:preprotein translocase subunit SecY